MCDDMLWTTDTAYMDIIIRNEMKLRDAAAADDRRNCVVLTGLIQGIMYGHVTVKKLFSVFVWDH